MSHEHEDEGAGTGTGSGLLLVVVAMCWWCGGNYGGGYGCGWVGGDDDVGGGEWGWVCDGGC